MTRRLVTISPVDGSEYVVRDWAQPRDVDATLQRAVDAQRSWRRAPIGERQGACTAMADAFVARKDDIANEITWQMGRPIRHAGSEVGGLEERARYMIDIAPEALARIELPKKAGFERHISREPVGVVFVIAPWNYPYLTAVNAIVPAILAGNAVVLKHSAQTPLAAERFAEAFREAGLPDGVFQYLHLRHEDADRVIRDPRIGHVAFTGSVAGGEAVEHAAAGRFIGVGLELGGKDPAYVRHDADLGHAVETAVDGAFYNAGQSCCAIERIYAHASVHDEFVERAVALVKQYRLGRPDDPDTTLGPLVRAGAADFVRGQCDEAVADGATAHVDPSDFPADARGTPYLAPQVLTGVDHTMRIMTEETFGPAIGIRKVGSDEEAIRFMNDSAYGLTAAVFTRDVGAGAAIGEQVEAGTFFVNRCDYLDPALAWTGVKQSGRGCSLSALGFEPLTRPKSFHMKAVP